jgi:2-amino-4-hydroxy-6-hydroxymethyldihydropteridine diphosphokinase
VTTAAIATGSNIGDRASNIERAIVRLAEVASIMAISPLYRSEPMYERDQPEFLNGAVLVETDLDPRALLAELKRIEAEVGRQARSQNGPREIDLDLIAWGGACYRYYEGNEVKPRLEIPHPRAAERRFVLFPLADIAPALLLPGIGLVRDLLKRTEHDAESVHPYEHAALPLLGP